MLEYFLEQLPQPDLAQDQHALPGLGDLVDSSPSVAGDLFAGTQESVALQAVQDRIQRSRAQHVTVKRKPFDDADAEDRAGIRVVEYVKADKTGHQVAITQGTSLIACRTVSKCILHGFI